MSVAHTPDIPSRIRAAFELDRDDPAQRIGSGHIHLTYKVVGRRGTVVLQRINKLIFKEPQIIADNLRLASDFLRTHFPDYRFLQPLHAQQGTDMVYDEQGFPWRMFAYQEGTTTLDTVENSRQAAAAAQGFGRLTRLLSGADVTQFRETIPDFHHLGLRYNQFESAVKQATPARLAAARDAMDAVRENTGIVSSYERMINRGVLQKRIMHNDTKINNILFDSNTHAVCVIDLDTLMPGYFIYDLGDMVRTYVSPVSEEEADFTKIRFRREIYEAVMWSYLSEMGDVLSPAEREAIPLAGKVMTYIMALRFLADYLRGNTYYHVRYDDQNLVRAGNQLTLLRLLPD